MNSSRQLPWLRLGLLASLLLSSIDCRRAQKLTEERRTAVTPTVKSSTVPTVSTQAAATVVSASATPAHEAAPRSPLIEAVRQWNEALLSRHRDAIERVYANSVTFYGQQQTKSQVVASKLTALEKAPDFRQTLENLQIEQRDTDRPIVLFEKQWVANGKPGKVRARLSLRREDNRWVVAEETDAPTDALFNRSSPYSDACRDAVLKLVVTTEEGQAYLMSRGPSSDYPANSARFEAFDWPKPEVAIQENNEGYRVTLAWFQVDLVDLTVMDKSSSSSKPIRTQATARAAVRAACKSSR